jgi:tight adherence protein B
MDNQLLFLLLVFGTVVLLFQSLFITVYSPKRASAKNIRKHLKSLANDNSDMQLKFYSIKNLKNYPLFYNGLNLNLG